MKTKRKPSQRRKIGQPEQPVGTYIPPGAYVVRVDWCDNDVGFLASAPNSPDVVHRGGVYGKTVAKALRKLADAIEPRKSWHSWLGWMR